MKPTAGSRWVGAISLALIAMAAHGGGQETAGVPGLTILLPAGTAIQAAVDAAPEGAVLELAPGRYVENITIGKSLTLRGSSTGAADIVGASAGPVVRISGEGIDVRLDSLSVSRARGYNGHGVAVDGSAEVILTGVILSNNDWCGVWGADYAHVVLVDCELARNGTSGGSAQDFARLEFAHCLVSGNMSHGVFTLHYSEVTLSSTEIRGNWTGIWAWDASRVTIRDSQLVENGDYGAMASTAALLVVEDSSVSGNGHDGLYFEASSRGILRRSSIFDNGADGLFAQEDAILEVTDCEFFANAGAGLRTFTGLCVAGGFDPKLYFAGRIEGSGNWVPGPGEEGGNRTASLCPAPPDLWPPGFLCVP